MATENTGENSDWYRADCGCRACFLECDRSQGVRHVGLTVFCPICGNKRCPHATAHWNPCSDSNEPGQPGSIYGATDLDSAIALLTPPTP